MEGTAVLGRLKLARARIVWRVATIRAFRDETPSAKTLVLDVDDWPGHRAGQHVDIRLTAEDGYQAQRSYSIASPPDGAYLELTIERINDGEVSPYLTEEARANDEFELRGPIGGYFVWDADDVRPLALIAGGSGLVPLMAMIRHHRLTHSEAPVHLLLSARTLEDVLYREELEALGGDVQVDITLTRGEPPPGWTGFNRRIDREMLAAVVPGPSERTRLYVCGPTPFVEQAARLAVELGHDPADVLTERFGPTGE